MAKVTSGSRSIHWAELPSVLEEERSPRAELPSVLREEAVLGQSYPQFLGRRLPRLLLYPRKKGNSAQTAPAAPGRPVTVVLHVVTVGRSGVPRVWYRVVVVPGPCIALPWQSWVHQPDSRSTPGLVTVRRVWSHPGKTALSKLIPLQCGRAGLAG